jgi:lipid-binding SYLF domain-containing protein
MKTARTHLALASLAAAAALTFAACSTAPDTATDKADLQARAASAVARAKQSDPTIAEHLRKAAGYAVFPAIGKGAVGVGGAYGKGVVYEQDMLVGYCDLTEGTIGAQLGGKSFTEILVFENRNTLDQFKAGTFTFDAQATAVALKSGAAANANFAKGVTVFTMDDSGLMFEASVGGQKFRYEPK